MKWELNQVLQPSVKMTYCLPFCLQHCRSLVVDPSVRAFDRRHHWSCNLLPPDRAAPLRPLREFPAKTRGRRGRRGGWGQQPEGQIRNDNDGLNRSITQFGANENAYKLRKIVLVLQSARYRLSNLTVALRLLFFCLLSVEIRLKVSSLLFNRLWLCTPLH